MIKKLVCMFFLLIASFAVMTTSATACGMSGDGHSSEAKSGSDSSGS